MNIQPKSNIYSFYTKLIVFFIGVVYCFSLAKDPLLGDSLIFTLQAYDGFVFDSNATNHILFSNFLALSHKILPFINIHFLCVGISLLSSILSLFFLPKLLNLMDISPKSSAICTLILGLSFTFWRTSIITEVYTFYILFVIFFLINFFKFIQYKETRYFYFASTLLGILFLIHIQTILFIPLYFYLVIKNFQVLKKNFIYGCLILSGLFSVLLIPVLLGHHPLISIFIMSNTEDSVFNIDLNNVLKSTIRNSGFLLYNFIFFLIFVYWGVQNKNKLDYILIAVFPFMAFCLKHDVSDSYVFHLVPYIFLIILIGRGIDKFPKLIPLLLPFLLPIMYLICFKAIENTSYGKNIEKEKGFKGGVKYLFLPPLTQNPDLDNFLLKYHTDSLYKKHELKSMYPFVIRWEKLQKNIDR